MALLAGVAIVGATVLLGALFYRYHVVPSSLPSGFDAFSVDPNTDGLSEYLVVRSRVTVPSGGSYRIDADLVGAGDVVSSTRGSVALPRGDSIVSVAFRGSDVKAAGVSSLIANVAVSGRGFTAMNSHAIEAAPATYEATLDAVELAGQPVVEPEWVNGKIASLRVTVPVEVNRAAYYQTQVQVSGGLGIAPLGMRDPGYYNPQHLDVGRHAVTGQIRGEDVFASGLRGGVPIYIHIFSNPNGHYCTGHGSGSNFLPPQDGALLGLSAPFVTPERPLGALGFETTVTVDHDFDAFAPMPLPADFTGTTSSSLLDANGDGLAESLQVTAVVRVDRGGTYDLSGMLYASGGLPASQVEGTRSTVYQGGALVSTAWDRLVLQPGTRQVTIAFPGGEIRAAGLDGPYEAKLRLVPAQVIIDPVIVHVTLAYTVDQFAFSGSKEARITDLQVGEGEATLEATPRASLLVRVIHENGIVVHESAGFGGAVVGSSGTVSTNFALPVSGEYAVAAYLLLDGRAVDYIEIVITA
jgi:hypothetical protein